MKIGDDVQETIGKRATVVVRIRSAFLEVLKKAFPGTAFHVGETLPADPAVKAGTAPAPYKPNPSKDHKPGM